MSEDKAVEDSKTLFKEIFGTEQLFGTLQIGIGMKAIANDAALRVPSVGVEAVADDRPSVSDHVADDGRRGHRHLAERDVGVADLRPNGNSGFANFEDLQEECP